MKIPMKGYGWERHGDGVNAPFTLPSPRDKSGVQVVDEAVIFLGLHSFLFEDEAYASRKPLPPELKELPDYLEAKACHICLLREIWAPSWNKAHPSS